MFKALFQPKSNQPREENLSGVLRVVGDRAAGKTTYMAAIARWPNANAESPVQTVTPYNKDSEDLVTKARNILEQGMELEPTRIVNDVAEIKDYTLRIAFKEQFSGNNSTRVTLDVSCKDYAGEFFSDLLHQAASPLLGDYLDDCLQATGILLLIDGTAYKKDAQYEMGVDKLLIALDKDIQKNRRRIALVLNKCEQPELWVNRTKPRFLAEARFEKVYNKLESWQKSGSGSVDYFTASALGILGNRYPKPNSKQIKRDRGGITSVLAEPDKWRPFGLVAPLYWLCTGKRSKELDKD